MALFTKLPSWVFILTVIIVIIIIVCTTWQSTLILKDIRQISNEIVELSQGIQRPFGTASWETYRNEEYGWEVQYPGDWQVLPAGKSISFRDKKYEGSFEWPGLRISTVDAVGEFGTAKESKIFNQDDAKNDIIRAYFIENGNKFYASCALYDYQNIDSTIKICNQILSTFKFIK